MRPWWMVVAIAGCGDNGGSGSDAPAPLTVTCDGPDVPGLPSISVVIDATHVYWNDGRGVIVRAPLGGGDPEAIAKVEGNTRGMAIDATSVYVAGGCEGFLSKVSKATGATISLVQIDPDGVGGSCVRGVTVDDQFAYFTAGARVARVPLGGGAIDELAAEDCPAAIVLAGETLAWTACVNEVHAMARGGGPVDVLSEDANFEALATDGESVYFVTAGEIRKQTGATQATITPAAGATALAVDGAAVYWAVPRGDPGVGSVSRKTFATGTVTELATTDRNHIGIAVDDSRVFFGGGTGCSVESVAK